MPITVFVSQANLLVAHPGRMPDVHTFQDLVAAAKARPGALNYGSAGLRCTPPTASARSRPLLMCGRRPPTV